MAQSVPQVDHTKSDYKMIFHNHIFRTEATIPQREGSSTLNIKDKL